MKKKALNSDFFSCNLGAAEHANFVWMKKQRFAYAETILHKRVLRDSLSLREHRTHKFFAQGKKKKVKIAVTVPFFISLIASKT